MALIPGLPPLPPSAAGLFSIPTLLTGDSVSATVAAGPTQWGLYDQAGNPVVIAQSVLDFDFHQAWRIADYPIEQGDFSSYDKVTTPFDARFTFAIGGDEAERATALSQLQAIGASFDLYNAVTPEITYTDVSVGLIGYRRSAHNGATLIKVDIGVRQIRQTGTQAFSQTAEPSGADQVNGGAVQPTDTPATTQSAISDFFGG